MQRILITGGCGFIGANFVRLELSDYDEVHVTNLDALTYAGNPDNLADLEGHPRYRFVQGDIADRPLVSNLLAEGNFDALVHFAAESHVDRSIDDAAPFLRTNVLGTQILLDAARAAKVPRYVQVSTDEVYGTLAPDDPPFTESTPLAPNSPYAASKAGADLLVRAAYHTHGLPTIITRCSNNYAVLVVSAAFVGVSRVARSRAVHVVLADEFTSGLHALSLTLRTPEEHSRIG